MTDAPTAHPAARTSSESGPSGVAGRLVLIAGATSASGEAVARALVAAGASVVAVGTRQEALATLEAAVPGVQTYACDLADRDAVAELAARVHSESGRVDGLIHLVGGWRGGGGLAGQSDEDWDFLERGFRTLRNTTRVFFDDLVASPAGRLAVVSSTSVEKPFPGGANYAAAKAAADAWVRAIAQGFSKQAPQSAAAIFVVKALEGLESQLGDDVVRLWEQDAATVNGRRLPLEPERMDG
ncbi:SDR family NAD(P)-dependent oxidoreductase [Leifsonia sp. fls2-241-R2A-40a]|uniref:SDR family NAD(P)-dependent oxidoreductase n=1 Tax=Leifsonia sp. fls2-241-R2A-40a TaxID=3040290 RepID=UPI00254BB624|nr:SDR family NAD(P)-dependent oxidoreductase [Leifsonia sp. fls2-241-R2A-40a]